MSVDTRTPPTPRGGSAQGYDETDIIGMAKVPSDPAQITVNNASFRVRLGPGSAARAGLSAPQDPAARRVMTTAGTAVLPRTAAPASGPARRRAPVVWTGHSAPGDEAAGHLLRAVRESEATQALPVLTADATATQVIPRIEPGDTQAIPRTEPAATVVAPRPALDGTVEETRLLPSVGGLSDGYDEPPAGSPDDGGDGAPRPRGQRHGADAVRHAYYPGRRMNLGVVLLPLRIFLGFVSIYAGMGRLCDPMYFVTDERGSLARWLGTLHPWGIARPLYDLAVAHPVGAGLTLAFLEVVVGVLTVCGLWQRIAAAFGALAAAALIMTVSWRPHPAYDAADIIFLAAWSPLIIAGAPVYSADARLAGQAWRRLGPRSELWELRRYVLRRGGVLAAFLIGATLLIGSMLGSAVRSSQTVNVPGPGEAPVNHLPGSPLPSTPDGDGRGGPAGSTGPSPARTHHPTRPSPSAPSRPGPTAESGSVGTSSPATREPARQQRRTTPQSPPSTGGSTGTSGGATGSGSQPSGGTDDKSQEPGLLGGVLG